MKLPLLKLFVQISLVYQADIFQLLTDYTSTAVVPTVQLSKAILLQLYKAWSFHLILVNEILTPQDRRVSHKATHKAQTIASGKGFPCRVKRNFASATTVFCMYAVSDATVSTVYR